LPQPPAQSQSLAVYWKGFLDQAFHDYDTLWEPPLDAGMSLAYSDFVSPTAGYGNGPKGYGHRNVAALGDNVNGKFMRQFVFAAASHQEDNYGSG
jgi:hypothetical protein